MKEKILVVDDDPAIIRIVTMILENSGYAVASASSGEAAYQTALGFQPDLTILDVNMPKGMSGFDTCQKFKSTPQLSDAPIIFLTAKVEQFEVGFELGGADYVLKPFNQKELIVRTQFHLRMRRLVKQVVEANSNLESKIQARTQDLTDTNKQLNQVITERKLLESRLKHESYTDFLTQIPSGLAFEHELQEVLDNCGSERPAGALLFLDICKFEALNHQFGWEAGDHFLISIAKLLQSQLGSKAIIARLGGDQFAVYLSQYSAAAANTVARGLSDCIASFSVPWNGASLQADVCVGFCLVGDTKSTAGKVLSKAISATMTAKEKGVGSVANYANHALDHHTKETDCEWSNAIQQALDNNSFTLFYQKVGGWHDTYNHLPSAEVLLRLKSTKSDRFVLPNEFFQFSSQTKLKGKVDFWVVKEVLIWLKSNLVMLNSLNHISINLSSETLADSMFLITLENLLMDSSIPASFLCFEISEPDALISIQRTRAFLTRLKSIGCKACLDDFGGQLAIHQHLNELPVDYLKINGNLLRNNTNSQSSEIILEMLKKIADINEKKLVAKHVEDLPSAEVLNRLGIDCIQGHFLHEPEPLAKLQSA